MSALDDLLSWFSGLSVQSVDVPNFKVSKTRLIQKHGAEVARRLRVRNSFGGSLSPTRYKASTQQTRSKQARSFGPEDIAASVNAIKDPVGRRLVLFFALPWWENDVPALFRGLFNAYQEAAGEHRWHADTRKTAHVEALLALVLREVQNEAACKQCNMEGEVFSPLQGWSECPRCAGSGVVAESQRTRWAKLTTMLSPHGLNVTHYQYRTRWDEPYLWLLDHVNGLLAEAWQDIRRDA